MHPPFSSGYMTHLLGLHPRGQTTFFLIFSGTLSGLISAVTLTQSRGEGTFPRALNWTLVFLWFFVNYRHRYQAWTLLCSRLPQPAPSRPSPSSSHAATFPSQRNPPSPAQTHRSLPPSSPAHPSPLPLHHPPPTTSHHTTPRPLALHTHHFSLAPRPPPSAQHPSNSHHLAKTHHHATRLTAATAEPPSSHSTGSTHQLTIVETTRTDPAPVSSGSHVDPSCRLHSKVHQASSSHLQPPPLQLIRTTKPPPTPLSSSNPAHAIHNPHHHNPPAPLANPTPAPTNPRSKLPRRFTWKRHQHPHHTSPAPPASSSSQLPRTATTSPRQLQ